MTRCTIAATPSYLSHYTPTPSALLHKKEICSPSPGAGAPVISLMTLELPELVTPCSFTRFACCRAGTCGGRTTAAGATLSSSADALLTWRCAGACPVRPEACPSGARDSSLAPGNVIEAGDPASALLHSTSPSGAASVDADGAGGDELRDSGSGALLCHSTPGSLAGGPAQSTCLSCTFDRGLYQMKSLGDRELTGL